MKEKSQKLSNMGGYCFIASFPILSLVLAAVVYLYSTNSIISNSVISNLKDDDDVLGAALKAVSTAEKTVIITVVNKAYVEPHNETSLSMLDLFLEGFWLGDGTKGLLDHLLVVAVDQTAYDRCRFRRLNCYKLETDGVDFAGEKLFMSDDFIKMMWRRTLFLLDVLKRGYNLIFTDTDILWLRNPFNRLRSMNHTVNGNDDMLMSIDIPHTTNLNTGFYFTRSNNKTIALFEKWYGMKDNSRGMKEQDVLAKLMNMGVSKQLDLRVKFLDTLYFNGFCTQSVNFHTLTTMHANCCRSISAKVTDLMDVLHDWKKFRANAIHPGSSFNNGTTTTTQPSIHLACEGSWK